MQRALEPRPPSGCRRERRLARQPRVDFTSRAWQAAHFANQMAIGTFYNDKMCLNDDTKYLALTFTNQVCNAM